MKEFNDLSRHEQEASLLFPLVKELKRLGGQATTSELKRSLVGNVDFIPENSLTHIKTSKNGNTYHSFDYPFNFAVTNLTLAKLFDRPKVGVVVLTETGREASYKFEAKEDEFITSVYQITEPLWKKDQRKILRLELQKIKSKKLKN